MKTRTQGIGLALAALLAALCAQRAWAVDAVPDTDALTITITPAVELAVDLDTATAKMEGSADLTVSLQLNATSFLVSPATATIKGNFNKQEVEVTAQGLDTWQIDTDEAIETDKVQVYALFAVNKASRPLEAEFEEGAASHLITGLTPKLAGEPFGGENDSGADNQFELATGAMASGANMDDLAPTTVRQLWLRLDTPSQSTSDEFQRIQVILTAVVGSTR